MHSPSARAGAAALVLIAFPPPAAAQPETEDILRYAREDPAKIVGAEACGECHLAAYEVWKETGHATGYKSLHRTETAEAIAHEMGYRLIKRRSICFTCHYTPGLDDGELRVISGVSCESCHGAARDWIDVHNDYGEGRDRESETPEHRRERIERSRRAGMRRPSDLYAVAGRCYGCHTVPIERLVNVGGHTTGSATFELVEWSQGDIRHNFLASFLAGSGRVNEERSVERRRVMYVTGRLLDLEHSLRGVARATEPGVYAKAMARRVRGAVGELRLLRQEAELGEVDAALDAVREVDVVPGNEVELAAAAERIAAATRSLIEQRDGTRLAAVDPLMLGTYEGPPPETERIADGAEPGAASGEEAAGPEPAAVPAAARAGSETAGAAPPAAAPARPAVVGERKRRIRPASDRRTLGPGVCSGCHGEQNAWWFEDPHFAAADPFFDRRPENVEIARLYGLGPAEMALGTAVCMDCHGTVVSGRESLEVRDGVGCEECHGAAGDWLEPHKDETDKELGRRRPGYLKALTLGKRDLHDLEVRAAACTGCHYVTDRRLLSAGHPSGLGFDYAGGMEKVRHWQEEAPPGALAAAFNAALSRRGPVPDVPVATLAATAAGKPAAAGAAAPPSGGASSAAPDRAAGRRATRVAVPRSRPHDPTALEAAAAAAVELPAAEPIGDDLTIEESLLAIKRRLEELYEAIE